MTHLTTLTAVAAAASIALAAAPAAADTTPRTQEDWTVGTSFGLGAAGALSYAAGAIGGTYLIFQAIEQEDCNDLFCGVGEAFLATTGGVLLVGPAAGAGAVYGVGQSLGYEGSWWATWGGAAVGAVGGGGLALLVGSVSEGSAGLTTFVIATPLLSGISATGFYYLSLDEPGRASLGAPASAVLGYTPRRGVHLGAPVPVVGARDGERVGMVPVVGGRF